MPTEAAFFFAGLLFLAAALGYVFARLGQLDDEDSGYGGSPNYIRGLKFLLEEQPDRALEAFSGSGELDEEAIEIHFALGQLFRRRGEMERAIRVHRDLIERPRLRREHRERAQFALAEDHLSAGLFDRAEALLTELRQSPRQGTDALNRLIRLAELTQEWEHAIELQGELERLDHQAAGRGRITHYLCELAEQARRAGDSGQAAEWLGQAAETRPESARVLWLRAEMAAAGNDPVLAARCYQRLAEHEPSLLVEVLPRFSAACRTGGIEAGFSHFLAGLCERDPAAARAVAFATMLDTSIDDPHAIECLRRFIQADPVLGTLLGTEGMGHPEGIEGEVFSRIRRALHVMARAGHGYRCLECGYASATLRWQCSGCGAWDSVRPRMRLAFDPEER